MAIRKFYAGIGSRATPPEVLALFTRMAVRLEELNYILRSGGAAGADSAFEQGTSSDINRQIFLPWSGFNGSRSSYDAPTTAAFVMASEHHPAWHRCSTVAKKFHARNCHQVLGLDLNDPVEFVVCWTPEGAVTGGTGQAIRLAISNNVPVFNFGASGAMETLTQFIKENV